RISATRNPAKKTADLGTVLACRFNSCERPAHVLFKTLVSESCVEACLRDLPHQSRRDSGLINPVEGLLKERSHAGRKFPRNHRLVACRNRAEKGSHVLTVTTELIKLRENGATLLAERGPAESGTHGVDNGRNQLNITCGAIRRQRQLA